MQFLLNHWHCILPIVGIVIAAILMTRDKPQKNTDSQETSVGHKE